MLGEFIDRRSTQCEDRDSEGAVNIMHSLRMVLAWGDGALVGSTVALGWSTIIENADDCGAVAATSGPSILIGVSGHYGWFGEVPEHLETDAAERWFGGSPDERPDAWTLGNPGWWSMQENVSRDTSFVLIGTLDDRDTERFASSLRANLVPLEVTLFEAGGHGDLIQPRGPLGSRALAVIIQVLGIG